MRNSLTLWWPDDMGEFSTNIFEVVDEISHSALNKKALRALYKQMILPLKYGVKYEKRPGVDTGAFSSLFPSESRTSRTRTRCIHSLP